MKKKKYVVVACGSGIATSNMVAGEIRDMCEAHRIKIYLHTCTILELPFVADDADLIVTTSKYQRDVGTPVVNGVPLLTGIGKEKALQEILAILSAEE